MRRPVIKGWINGILPIIIVGIILALQGLGNVSRARAQSPGTQSSAAAFSWEYALDFTASSSSAAKQLSSSLDPALSRQGVAASLQTLGETSYRLKMTGSQGIEQVRQVLYSPRLAGFIGGAAEIEVNIPANGLQDTTFKLESNPSTGYRWELAPADTNGFNQKGETAFLTRSSGYGVPSVQTLVLHSTNAQAGKVKLIYRRPFGPADVATRHLRITLTTQLIEIDLSNPHPKSLTTQLATSDGYSPPDPVSLIPLRASLPSSLDWRTAGIVPAVRDQGNCGSCWAFGTVGIMESAIAKAGGSLTDLSEQFLVSCNKNYWNCEDGGWTASMYHYDVLGKNQTTVGAVLETDKPYTATNGSCTVAYAHPYKLSGWKFIVNQEWEMPTVDQIKTAIATYGPVTAGVCAGGAFQSYRGGIFSTDENCGGWTNHQIILVGWNDSDGGYWILRNSWGHWWGEDGYMRIAYNTSRVGEGTSWVTWAPQMYYFPLVTR